MTDQSATARMQEAKPLAATLGVRAEKYAAEEVALSLEWAPGLCTTNGILHGGVTPLHLGGTTMVVETSVRDASSRLVAKVTQTQVVLRARS
jgi:1,4-dihydroxy-2-naphthoyl-CoA hydrolase